MRQCARTSPCWRPCWTRQTAMARWVVWMCVDRRGRGGERLSRHLSPLRSTPSTPSPLRSTPPHWPQNPLAAAGCYVWTGGLVAAPAEAPAAQPAAASESPMPPVTLSACGLFRDGALALLASALWDMAKAADAAGSGVGGVGDGGMTTDSALLVGVGRAGVESVWGMARAASGDSCENCGYGKGVTCRGAAQRPKPHPRSLFSIHPSTSSANQSTKHIQRTNKSTHAFAGQQASAQRVGHAGARARVPAAAAAAAAASRRARLKAQRRREGFHTCVHTGGRAGRIDAGMPGAHGARPGG
eukprot:366435-Chlamydomonas_euryale.AAC.2